MQYLKRITTHPVYRKWKSGCYYTGWFHLLYWSYKCPAVWRNDDTCYSSNGTRARKVVVWSLGMMVGMGIGALSTIIWPVSTPLTIINIDERVEKDYGFFFYQYKKTGLNRQLYRMWKALFY